MMHVLSALNEIFYNLDATIPLRDDRLHHPNHKKEILVFRYDHDAAANMAGIPGVSVPCGFSDGLPVGLQILGKSFDEATVLRVAHAYERATAWHKARPVVGAVA